MEARLNIGLFRRHRDSLGQAIGLIDELQADAISAEDCATNLAVLADTNPDINGLSEAHDDPVGQRLHLEQELDRVFAILDSVGAPS